MARRLDQGVTLVLGINIGDQCDLLRSYGIDIQSPLFRATYISDRESSCVFQVASEEEKMSIEEHLIPRLQTIYGDQMRFDFIVSEH